jgi:hypothetical protein
VVGKIETERATTEEAARSLLAVSMCVLLNRAPLPDSPKSPVFHGQARSAGSRTRPWGSKVNVAHQPTPLRRVSSKPAMPFSSSRSSSAVLGTVPGAIIGAVSGAPTRFELRQQRD